MLKKYYAYYSSKNVIFFGKTGLNSLKTEYNASFEMNMLHIKTNIL